VTGRVLTISVDFRSTGAIIERVNREYATELAAPGLPGFTALTAFRWDERREVVQVLKVEVGPEALDDTVDGLRLMEAPAVADFLQRIIGSLELRDKEGTGSPACRAMWRSRRRPGPAFGSTKPGLGEPGFRFRCRPAKAS
jgi:hypothetical protein